jgi:hypothetical protein
MEKKYWLFSILIGIIAGVFIGWGNIVTAIVAGLTVGTVVIAWTAYNLGKAIRTTSTVDILFDAAIMASSIIAITSLLVSSFNWMVAVFVFIVFVIVYGIIALAFTVLYGNKYVQTGNPVGWG